MNNATEVVVAVDANGADLGPAEVAAGAALAAQQGARVLLFGPRAEMDMRAEIGPLPAGMEVVDAPLSIAKSPDPARAARANPEASIVQTARAVAEGRAQALVCAGGTGAALAAGLFNVKRARGIHRPALALPLPVPGHPVTLLDVGANAQAREEHLVQFAFMGAAFAQVVLDVRRPRVGLLSNGEEQGRGSPLVVAARAQLVERLAAAAEGSSRGAMLSEPVGNVEGGAALAFEFVGNVEGGDLTSGVADVIVTDGFTGNVALKVMEGVSQTMLRSIRDAALSSSRAKLGGALLRPALRSFRDQIDPEGQGGAYLLGLRQLGVVPHGSFTRHGFAQAILRAARGAQEDLVGRTHAALEQAGALRTAPSRSGS
ncbi:MAG TPA: phosphate acyltransferase PlsX [Solirubrobacteraceae bacterium]|nr:phosphate acyltransferase PlsX [Solirubrobacteraceae bacterium]